MQRVIRKTAAVLLVLCVMLSISAFAESSASPSIQNAVGETGRYLLNTVEKPQVGAIGGEWAVIGLARSGCNVPQNWYDTYYKNLISYVEEKHGVLSTNKYTEYARVILAVNAIGKDPADLGGYNLLKELGDYNKVIWQGINSAIFALIALDSDHSQIPVCKGAAVQTTRQLLINQILSLQLPDGGFSLDGKSCDPDTTAMALQALAPYREQDAVKNAVHKALDCLSKLQNSCGGYDRNASGSSESSAQVLVALTALGIDPESDSRFLKNGISVVDNLMTFYMPGGGFKHGVDDAGPNEMATEQAFYSLVAYERFLNGKKPLYDMSDTADLISGDENRGTGLPGKNPDIKASAVLYPGKTFEDIAGSGAQAAVEVLASRGIINGVSETRFEPNSTMTRAQFAAITVRALGITPKANNAFSDVKASSWYASYVGTANTYGIVNGTSDKLFSPQETITREQAAVMVARAAKLCGMDTARNRTQILDALAPFSDYTKCSNWARESLAFCYQNGILPKSILNIQPKEAVSRAEIAQMIDQMLRKSELI